MRREKLNQAEAAAALAKLPGWAIVGGKLHREFVCKDFVDAFGKMASVALEAEKLDHHPEWSNVWNKVTVDLVTHSAGGLTEFDFALAQKISNIFGG